MHVLIIGAYGSAGSAVAETLAPQVGPDGALDQLTLVDDGEPGGGLCILQGCMPSKAVLSAAGHRYQARADERLRGEPATIDLESVVDIKDDQVLGFAEHRRAAIQDLTEQEGVTFIHDTAQFVDDRVVEVGDERFNPDYVVVATGSAPNIPNLDGMDSVSYMGSADVLDATSLPESGIVMGFGYVGIELVPYLVEAGVSDLTVIEHDERPIDEADPEFGDELLSLYREEFGVTVLTETHERRIEQTADGVRLTVDRDGAEETVEAEELFLFTGRQPNLDRLQLAHTTLSPEEGWVRPTMQAADDDRVYVVGDVNSREPILHVAKEQGYTAGENILRAIDGEAQVAYENIHHHVIFSGASVYPFARVGHTKASAMEAGHTVVEATRWAADDGVFNVKDIPWGLARLTVDADTGVVLGYQGLHADADTMAKTMQVIIELGLDVRTVPDRSYHPTLPEILDGLFRETAALVE
ncbi:NAD(P)/FAD-dependent oxidoreductase [Halorubraceae archaeon YAN]|nr:NAD(P)/FAD-dependent oxidoreductase [Halorubraceae archaeon YAN]